MNNNWRFLLKPFWLFTHFFVLTVVVGCLFLSNWQFIRLAEKKEFNTNIQSKTQSERLDIDSALKLDNLEYRPVKASVEIVKDDLIRVVNRSYQGAAGEHVVALAKLESNKYILVNRGFVPLNVDDIGLLTGQDVTVEGWLRNSIEKDFFGVTDNLNESQAPRFDVNAISQRIDPEQRPVNFWIQVETIDGVNSNDLPIALSLPDLDEGSHLSYAMQWIVFALLTIVFYFFILRRKSKQITADE